jgi:serine/threonine protein kinase
MAPEIWSQQILSKQTDIYALAVTIFEIFFGPTPDRYVWEYIYNFCTEQPEKYFKNPNYEEMRKGNRDE